MIDNWIYKLWVMSQAIEAIYEQKKSPFMSDTRVEDIVLNIIKHLRVKIRESFYDPTIKYAFKS